jgi:hypothetical protein
MYTHKKCGGEVFLKSIVHEYAPILNIEKGGYVETGDVEESTVEDSEIWCEECCMTVATLDVAGISKEIWEVQS